VTLDEMLDRHRLVVCVGPGGAGKTTVAATLAVEAARRGRRALALTIDPARRLASALGLGEVGDEARAVPLRAPGTLHAAMLETRASYDALVSRAADPDRAARIHENRIYRAFSRTLARSHAYVAMERLHHVEAAGEHDLVVLDTPPQRTALDLLDAPGRLVSFLDESVVRWFLDRVPDDVALDPSQLPAVDRAALRALSIVTSRALVAEMVEFFQLFAPLREGFAERARESAARLRANDTAFVVVASPSPVHLEDARAVREGLAERGLAPRAVVVNRGYVPDPRDPARPIEARAVPDVATRLASLFGRDAPNGARTALAAMDAARERAARTYADALNAADSLAGGGPRVVLPELHPAPASVGAIAQLADVMRARWA
jgi:anion-transporting  ArsA/GET3 family ATPase